MPANPSQVEPATTRVETLGLVAFPLAMMPVVWHSATGGAAVLTGAIAILSVIAIGFFSILHIAAARSEGRSPKAVVCGWIVSSAFCLSVIAIPWPLWLAFLASEPAFRSAMEQVRAGEEVRVPFRAGPYTVYEVSEHEGLVRFRTDDDFPNSRGFVYDPTGKAESLHYSERRFGRHWRHWCEF